MPLPTRIDPYSKRKVVDGNKIHHPLNIRVLINYGKPIEYFVLNSEIDGLDFETLYSELVYLIQQQITVEFAPDWIK